MKTQFGSIFIDTKKRKKQTKNHGDFLSLFFASTVLASGPLEDGLSCPRVALLLHTIMCYTIQSTDYRLQTTGHRLQATDYRLKTTDYRL